MGARSNVDEYLAEGPVYPEKLVIIAEPDFGTAIRLLLFGAALGAAGVYYLNNKATETSSLPGALPGSTAGNAKKAESVAERAKNLAGRVKYLAGQAQGVAEIVGTRVKPVVQSAIEEGRKAAQATQEAVNHQLATEPDTVYAKEVMEEEA